VKVPSRSLKGPTKPPILVGLLKIGGLASTDNPCEGTKGTERRLASSECSQVSDLTTKQSDYGYNPEGNCWGVGITLSPWNIRVEVETSIGKVTGDGSTPTAMGCRAGYQSKGFPSRKKTTKS
jgi:hypothetical protein